MSRGGPSHSNAVCLRDFRIDWLLARDGKEIFHLASRRKSHQPPSRPFTDVGPHMGTFRGASTESPGRSVKRSPPTSITSLLPEVEPFFLRITQMAHWPALGKIAMLDQKETGLGVFGRHLVIQVCAFAWSMMLHPSRVRACGDKHWLSQRACNFSERSQRRNKRQRHRCLQ